MGEQTVLDRELGIVEFHSDAISSEQIQAKGFA